MWIAHLQLHPSAKLHAPAPPHPGKKNKTTQKVSMGACFVEQGSVHTHFLISEIEWCQNHNSKSAQCS